jgi:hypothetical protein
MRIHRIPHTNAGLLLTYLKPAWDDRLEEVNLDTSENCLSDTINIFHVRKDRQPLTLVQLCYTKLLVHVIENCEDKQLIDIRKTMQKASFETSVIYPDYYEVVSVLNPMIVKRVEHYDLPAQKRTSFKNKLKILFKALI